MARTDSVRTFFAGRINAIRGLRGLAGMNDSGGASA